MGPPSHYDPNSPNEQAIALPNEHIRKISDRLSVQPPLTRRGHGPGMLIFQSTKIGTPMHPKPLDPEPVQKWAEEGFTVAFTSSGEPSKAAIADILVEAEGAFLRFKEFVDVKDKYAVVVYNEGLLEAVTQALAENPHFVCAVAFAASVPGGYLAQKPTLLHLLEAKGETAINSPAQKHTYPVKASSFVLPNSAEYSTSHASLAHTRSLVFLRRHLGGPHFDLEAIWEEHCYFEFEVRSVAKTMATMVAEPYVNHVPTMTGGIGREALTRFYRDHFIFSNPPDVRLQVISRTVGPDRVIDEFISYITHDRTVDWLLPGVPATGRKLAIPMMGVINVRGDRLYNEHIWWDQGTVLLQAGLLPSHVPFPTPEGTKSLRLPVGGVETAKMLEDETQGTSNEMMGEGWGVLPQ